MINNPVQLVANLYLELLSLPVNNKFRIQNQSLYAVLRITLAKELDESDETVQRVFERLAKS